MEGTENSVAQIYAIVRIQSSELVTRPGKNVLITLYARRPSHAPSKQDSTIATSGE